MFVLTDDGRKARLQVSRHAISGGAASTADDKNKYVRFLLLEELDRAKLEARSGRTKRIPISIQR